MKRYKQKMEEAEYAPELTDAAISYRAMCPYFKRTSGTTITCDGPAPGSAISYSFPSRESFAQQIVTWCCGRYDYCEIFRAVDEAQNDE